jgi:hypothetical protein
MDRSRFPFLALQLRLFCDLVGLLELVIETDRGDDDGRDGADSQDRIAR